MRESFSRGHSGLASAPPCNDFMVFAPDALSVLADMREQCVFLFFQHRRDIHVGIGQKPLRLRPGIDFKKEEQRTLAQRHPTADRQHARHLVIHVCVHRPVRKYHVRLFLRQDLGHRFHVRVVDLGRTVDLPKESRASPHHPASFLAFSGSDLSRFIQTLVANSTFATGEVENRHGLTQLRVAAQCAGASRFRIIGVPSNTEDFELAAGLGGRGSEGWRLRCREKGYGQQGRVLEESAACYNIYIHSGACYLAQKVRGSGYLINTK